MTEWEQLTSKVAAFTKGRRKAIELGAGDRKWAQYVSCPYVSLDIVPGCDIVADMRDVDSWWDDDFDTVLMMDSLEHLNRQDGLDLLSDVLSRGAVVIAFVPLGYHPQDHGPDHPNTHRTTYEVDDPIFNACHLITWNAFHADKTHSKAAALAVWGLTDV